MEFESDSWFLRSSRLPTGRDKEGCLVPAVRHQERQHSALLPVAATAHAFLPCQGVGGEWAARVSSGPIGSEHPRPPGRWTQLDPGGGRRRRGQPRGRGGGGARSLEAEPGAVSPGPAAAAAAVPYMLWPGWLPTLPPAARRPGIPRRLPRCWPGAQVRLAALPRHSVPSSASFCRAGAPSGLCQPRCSPCRPGAVPGGGTTVFPSPPYLQAPRLLPGSLGRASASSRGAGPEPPPPGPITQSLGLWAGVPS